MSKLAVIDPMTLLGRDFLAELSQRNYDFDQIELFHSSEVEEHQVTSAGGRAMMVSRLGTPEDLLEMSCVVLCSDVEQDGLEYLDAVLERNPDLLFINASSILRYRHLASPLASSTSVIVTRRLRLADPSLVIALHLMDVLNRFNPNALSISALQPVSALGNEGVEILARQSAQRLQGQDLEEDEEPLAFNIRAIDGMALKLDAMALFPDFETVATLATGACFHGHLVHLGLSFDETLSAEDVESALRSSDRIRRIDFPIDLSVTVNRAEVLVGQPSLSEDGKHLLLQAMADGSLIGGAMILADFIEAAG